MAVGQIRSYSEAAQVRSAGPACYYCSAEATTRTGNKPICRKHDEDRHTEESKKWLLDRGIVTEGMTTGERQKATAAYRASLGARGVWVKPDIPKSDFGIAQDDDDAPPF